MKIPWIRKKEPKIEDSNIADFNALTPNVMKEKDIEESYKDSLYFATTNENIFNIAITGAYGSGKSTIWRTYEKNYLRKNNKFSQTLTITFGKYNQNNELDKNDKSKKHDTLFYNRIERQIINDLVVQIDSQVIPLYKNKVQQNFTGSKVFNFFFFFVYFLTVIFVTVMLFILLVYLPNTARTLGIKILISLLLIFVLGIILYVLAYFFWSKLRLRIHKINIKGINIETSTKSLSEETILEKEIKEIIYLIHSSKRKFIVFEDLDRFNDIKIFERLKQINNLVNKHCKIMSSKWRVKFIYMISDAIFDAESRTKFFDFIIPVASVKNSTKVVEEVLAKANKKEISYKKIQSILNVIPNIRLLQNIVNEFKILEPIINKNNKNEITEVLFSALIIKNLLPEEFAELQKQNGVINKIFTNYNNFLNWTNTELNNKLDQNYFALKNLLNLNYLIVSKILELRTEIIKISYENTACIKDNYLNNYKNTSLKENSDPLANLLEGKIDKISVVYKKENQLLSAIYTLDEFNQEFIKTNQSLKTWIDNIKKESIELQTSLKKENNIILNKLTRLKKYSLNELLNILDWEKSKNSNCEKWFSDLNINSEKLYIIKELMNNNFIDEKVHEFLIKNQVF
ncbi:uncharacterized protein MPUT_0509 [Mycoplasma putrefaciens KS1]|uniref:YobI-like P-loop NTPase domain-containing protein n=1 Tax=Mycoplasma putrefaciens (strain ATCC 15718 / NCTC 10155 / C30 KS-1 / KS-1) TaxID=743965 RepID=A0A7U4E9F8_MYCPK|nr:uncharacterized protein MPUT_0509 [Mycoplasma putrefaciens KS1]